MDDFRLACRGRPRAFVGGGEAVAWSDKVDDWFADAHLHLVDGVGHFVPLEASEVFAQAILSR